MFPVAEGWTRGGHYTMLRELRFLCLDSIRYDVLRMCFEALTQSHSLRAVRFDPDFPDVAAFLLASGSTADRLKRALGDAIGMVLTPNGNNVVTQLTGILVSSHQD